MVNSGSCIQQSLNCLHMSLMSSYLQRNTAILYESMSKKEKRENMYQKQKH